MGARWPSVQTTTIVNATVVTTAETVIITTPPLSPPFDNSIIYIMWYIVLTTGAGSTQVRLKLRRGTTTAGQQVNLVNNLDSTAGATLFVDGQYVDMPGVVAGQQYSVTVVMQNAAGNSAVQDACMLAFSL